MVTESPGPGVNMRKILRRYRPYDLPKYPVIFTENSRNHDYRVTFQLHVNNVSYVGFWLRYARPCYPPRSGNPQALLTVDGYGRHGGAYDKTTLRDIPGSNLRAGWEYYPSQHRGPLGRQSPGAG